MATVHASGTQAATPGTEHTLATITTAGTYVLLLDDAARQAGEALTIRVYGTVLASGAERLIRSYALGPLVSGEPYLQDIPRIVGAGGIRYTIQQTGGTGRSYPWSVVAL